MNSNMQIVIIYKNNMSRLYLWDMIEALKLSIAGLDEGALVKAKDIEKPV
jgi:hypothetical protein